MSLALQPTGGWIEITIEAGTPDTTIRLAPRPWPDPPSYYGGLKRGRLTRLGDVLRSLSDRSGSPTVARFNVEAFDPDGSLRALLDTLTYLTRADLTYYLASARAHDLDVLAEPRVAFRGQVLTPAPRPGRLFTIDAESRMGTRYGPFDYDAPVLKRAYGTDDFPNLPRDNQGKAVRFLWGEKSDEGTTSQVPGPGLDRLDVAKGELLPVACGYLPGTTPSYLLPPVNLQVAITGSGPTKRVRIAVTFRNANGETTPTILEVANYPAHPGPFPGPATYYAEWTWDDPNSPPVASGRVFLDNLDGTGWHNLDAGYLTYTDDGDDDHWKSLYPGPPTVNGAVAGTAQRFYCVSANPGRIITIYRSDLAQAPAYVPVGIAEVGPGNVFDLGPDDTGYVYTAASGREYFGFLARGPAADAHDSGAMPFRVNACGWHDDGTPPRLIDRAAYVYQDVITQLQGNGGQGWQGGPRLTIPTFASSPAVPILQSSSFEAVQQTTIADMATPDGAKATVVLASFDLTWRQWLEGMNRTFQFDSGENHHGQFLLALQAAVPDLTVGPLLREYIDLRRVEDAGEPHPDEIENALDYQFDPSDDGGFRSGLIPLSDPPSIAGYGLRKRPQSLDLVYTRDAATAAWSAFRYLTDHAVAPRYPAVVSKFRKALAIELGTQFRVEHSDFGPGIVTVYCRDQGASVARGEVTLRGRRRGAVVVLVVAGDDTAGSSWADASPDERATLGFVTDDDGLVPGNGYGARAM